MAHMQQQKRVSVEEASLGSWGSRRELREHLLTAAERPLVFRGGSREKEWVAPREWSPGALCRLLGAVETTFKVCPRRGSEQHQERFTERETVFETQCLHMTATFLDFRDWLELSTASDTLEPPQKKTRTANPLLVYPAEQYWVYADYKYVIQLSEAVPELLHSIDWKIFGFDGRGGADSALWVGSEEACTPCHYDTYGCNLVAQVWGRKTWTLFSPSDSPHLYPTRIPYEESSVFSKVNVVHPDLELHPHFTTATSYEVSVFIDVL